MDARRRTWWEVTRAEVAVTARVAAASDNEACAVAWRQWYGRTRAHELEWLARDAREAVDTGEGAEGNGGRHPS